MKALLIAGIAACGGFARAESALDLPWGSGPVMARSFPSRVGASVEFQSPGQIILVGGKWKGVSVVRWTLDFEAGQLSRCTVVFATEADATKACNAPGNTETLAGVWRSLEPSRATITYRIHPGPAEKPLLRPMPELPSGQRA